MNYAKYIEYIEGITESEAVSEGAALFTKISGESHIFIIYDFAKAKKIIDEIMSDSKRYARALKKGTDDFIGCILSGGELLLKAKNPLHSFRVAFTGSFKKGYGSLLYDIMLSYAGKKGIVPDRTSVSKYAERIWDYYYDRRSYEIKTVPVDNVLHPLTKSKKDDSTVHKPIYPDKNIQDTPPVDRIFYFKDTKMKFQRLKKQNENFLKSLNKDEKELFLKAFLEHPYAMGNIYYHASEQKNKQK